MPDLDQLDVFYGDLTINRAYVYARLPLPEGSGWSLSGQVRGPRCLWAETLPVTSPLADLGPGPTLLARATLTDPCFWSPDLPAIYDVTMDLRRGSEVVASARREIGLRALGIRGRYLALESKRWVLRGVHADSTTARLPRQWHETAAGYIAASGNDELLSEASQFGAMTIAEVHGTPEEIVRRLRRLSAFPAVAVVLVHGELPADFKASAVAPNLLLAQPLGRHESVRVQGWAQLLWAGADDSLLLRQAALAEMPVIACRKPQQPLPLAEARAACDALQRDLAPIGQFAGYIV